MIQVSLTPEEVSYILEALEYTFDHSRLSRSKAKLYGRVSVKLQDEKAFEEEQPDFFRPGVQAAGQESAQKPPQIADKAPPEPPATTSPTEPEAPEIEPQAQEKDAAADIWAKVGFELYDEVVVLATGEMGKIYQLYDNAVDIHLDSGTSLVCKEGEFELPGFAHQEAQG